MIFAKKPYRELKVGGFKFTFYVSDKISTQSRLEINEGDSGWSMRIGGNCHAFGYLLAACEQGKEEQLHGYAVIMYTASMLMTQDQGFTDDLTKSVVKYVKRMQKQAKTNAANTTEEDIIRDEIFMESAIERGRYRSKKDAKRFRDEMKRVLREDEESGKQA